MIYVLQCEGNKFWVSGNITSINAHISEHNAGKYYWTQVYPIVGLYESHDIKENNPDIIHGLMALFGVDNVRGDRYPNIGLCYLARMHILLALRPGCPKIAELAKAPLPLFGNCIECGVYGHEWFECGHLNLEYRLRPRANFDLPELFGNKVYYAPQKPKLIRYFATE
jgi:hypothetical protein